MDVRYFFFRAAYKLFILRIESLAERINNKSGIKRSDRRDAPRGHQNTVVSPSSGLLFRAASRTGLSSRLARRTATRTAEDSRIAHIASADVKIRSRHWPTLHALCAALADRSSVWTPQDWMGF